MNNIAIIPARGGSKRIPHKNIKDFCGKPIIAYSIEAAIKSGLFSEVMVSTDSAEIADVAKKYGATVPFFRSKKTSDDHAIIKDVLQEVLENYKSIGRTFDSICCLLSTAPFVSALDLINSFKLLSDNVTAVLPVVKFSYTIFRAVKLSNSNKISMFWPKNYSMRSQDLPEAFHDAGLFYWYSPAYFNEHQDGFGSNSYGFEISEMKAQDIDTEEDWKMAELKYNIINKNMIGGGV